MVDEGEQEMSLGPDEHELVTKRFMEFLSAQVCTSSPCCMRTVRGDCRRAAPPFYIHIEPILSTTKSMQLY